MEIKNRFSGKVIYKSKAKTAKEAVGECVRLERKKAFEKKRKRRAPDPNKTKCNLCGRKIRRKLTKGGAVSEVF